jgi:predicted DNA-binding transcriptional regulator AlpA
MTTTPSHSALEPLLTVHELSEYLGIPVATLYDWRVDGVGPKAVKLGRSLRYPRVLHSRVDRGEVAWLGPLSRSARSG